MLVYLSWGSIHDHRDVYRFQFQLRKVVAKALGVLNRIEISSIRTENEKVSFVWGEVGGDWDVFEFY